MRRYRSHHLYIFLKVYHDLIYVILNIYVVVLCMHEEVRYQSLFTILHLIPVSIVSIPHGLCSLSCVLGLTQIKTDQVHTVAGLPLYSILSSCFR